jgi:hypothetical protein
MLFAECIPGRCDGSPCSWWPKHETNVLLSKACKKQ